MSYTSEQLDFAVKTATAELRAALEARAGAARLHGAFMAARPDDPQFAE